MARRTAAAPAPAPAAPAPPAEEEEPVKLPPKKVARKATSTSIAKAAAAAEPQKTPEPEETPAPAPAPAPAHGGAAAGAPADGDEVKSAAADDNKSQASGKTSSASSQRGVKRRTPGSNVSGRAWKAVQQQRTSAMARRPISGEVSKSRYAANKLERELRLKQRAERAAMKQEIIDAKRQARAKREDQKRKRLEAELRGTTYQVINPQKVKTMNKKQLKQIKKTRVNPDGSIVHVGIYE